MCSQCCMNVIRSVITAEIVSVTVNSLLAVVDHFRKKWPRNWWDYRRIWSPQPSSTSARACCPIFNLVVVVPSDEFSGSLITYALPWQDYYTSMYPKACSLYSNGTIMIDFNLLDTYVMYELKRNTQLDLELEDRLLFQVSMRAVLFFFPYIYIILNFL